DGHRYDTSKYDGKDGGYSTAEKWYISHYKEYKDVYDYKDYDNAKGKYDVEYEGYGKEDRDEKDYCEKWYYEHPDYYKRKDKSYEDDYKKYYEHTYKDYEHDDDDDKK
ncbi:hypothetical protein OIO90_006663, partial [Microbotryomycetes sp. JL221]